MSLLPLPQWITHKQTIDKHRQQQPEANQKQIAQQTGLSIATVSKTIAKINNTETTGKTTRTLGKEALQQRILAYKKEHPKATQQEIAKKFEVNQSTVQRALKDKGIMHEFHS